MSDRDRDRKHTGRTEERAPDRPSTRRTQVDRRLVARDRELLGCVTLGLVGTHDPACAAWWRRVQTRYAELCPDSFGLVSDLRYLALSNERPAP